MLDIPLIKYTGSHCFRCDKDTIVAFDTKNRQISYVTRSKDITTQDIMDSINSTTLSYMKCLNCGTKYIIDYSLGFPRPIETDYIRDNFFNSTVNR